MFKSEVEKRGWVKIGTSAAFLLMPLSGGQSTATAAVPAGTAFVQAPPNSLQVEVRKLEQGHAVERELKGEESHTYEISLEAGQYVNIVVDQRGVDVKVTVIGPDGKLLFEFD